MIDIPALKKSLKDSIYSTKDETHLTFVGRAQNAYLKTILKGIKELEKDDIYKVNELIESCYEILEFFGVKIEER